MNTPDFVFEVSWEVCNKVGGIHTVLSSKALTMDGIWGDRYFLIGPDIWKGSGRHPEFIEDESMFNTLKNRLNARGIKIRTGRWNTAGNPTAILVDFTTLFPKKNEIFRDLWLKYKVDSISGEWDYTEPALFGYAAGAVIESFYQLHLTFSDKICAHFHEWMTGVGLLYLNEHVPQIGTVFTTHATVVGRAIAGSGRPLFSKSPAFSAESEAKNHNVIAKHSLEKTSAIFADCFTTVSDITATECGRFLNKKPDVVTSNGFDDFIVPDDFLFNEKRTIARKTLIKVASALLQEKIPDDAVFLLQSGRYEFRNKGIDVFIDALGMLAEKKELSRTVIAFLCIPAHSTGPRKDIIGYIEHGKLFDDQGLVLTHHLHGGETDPVIQRMEQNGLNNRENNKVRVVFSPVYLDGRDGIYNLSYYDLLIGFDLSVFPSYYEPWGYTPMESMAFHIPTITSNLTGFGLSFRKAETGIGQGIEIINRENGNDRDAATAIARTIQTFLEMSSAQVEKARNSAHQYAKFSLWKNAIQAYRKAYDMALGKAEQRAALYEHDSSVIKIEICDEPLAFGGTQSEPVWRKIFVQLQLPEKLKALETIAGNLWWTWHNEAVELFSEVDNELWLTARGNPIVMLNSLSAGRMKQLESDSAFIKKLGRILKSFQTYMQVPVRPSPVVAYFCMEYGLHQGLSLYSGGLGILAGDYLKQSSDSCLGITGIGLLYRNGYFIQDISSQGEQQSLEDLQKFTALPLHPVFFNEDEWMKISIVFPGRTIFSKVWRLDVGRVSLYLLDTDIPENNPEDRLITAQLYGGDREHRLQQELLLGIGGIRLLKLLNISPDIFHFNEGHAAFAGIERLRLLITDKYLAFDEALEVVRASTVFTTHTQVPAGHDFFQEEQLRVYLSHHPDMFNISWQRLMELGMQSKYLQTEKFSMSILAIRLSSWINGVSKSHRDVTKQMFAPLWEGYTPEELQIGSVTNGVHWPTWTSPEWQALFAGKALDTNLPPGSGSYMLHVTEHLTDTEIWQTHLECKQQLIWQLQKRLGDLKKSSSSFYSGSNIHLPDQNTMIITFARRMVGYKRPLLIFRNPDKLADILNNPQQPVVFLFSGKAHPKDIEGQRLIHKLLELSMRPEFSGKILFLPNYDMELASYLVKGSDVWLNTPQMNSEASGTSGMKAAMNGVLNFSISDGWWAEASQSETGWTITGALGNGDSDARADADSAQIYKLLNEEIIPAYFNRTADHLPQKWIAMMKKALTEIVPQFTSERMINEYLKDFYRPAFSHSLSINSDNFKTAKALAKWKNEVSEEWHKIRIVSRDIYDSANKPLPLGQELSPKITLDICNFKPEEIGVEIVLIKKRNHANDSVQIISNTELNPLSINAQIVTFGCQIKIQNSGVFEYGFRIYPKNPYLKNRQDLSLTKWI